MSREVWGWFRFTVLPKDVFFRTWLTIDVIVVWSSPSPLLVFQVISKIFDNVLSKQNSLRKELVRKGLKSDPKALEK